MRDEVDIVSIVTKDIAADTEIDSYEAAKVLFAPGWD